MSSESFSIVFRLTSPKGVLLALHYIPTGIASTIMSLVPVCLIPFAIFLHKEHVSVKAITGALIAVFGIYFLSA